jgi:dTDP-4-amino-4,6-dideoxygalactose transaminase
MKTTIEFNRPFFTGRETEYIQEAVQAHKISGDGIFTKKCHRFFQERYHFPRVFLTTSCTDALEMCALLLDIKPDDEIIIPSFTFSSTANAFVLRGARIIFADSESTRPHIDAAAMEGLISSKTKAIVVVHYAGTACEMDRIMSIAEKHQLMVIEDAAQAIDSYYKNIPLGSFGKLAAFSFHESKNVISGEGGMLVVNDDRLVSRSEILWEKGTNRAALFRGEVDKYSWLDVGSSFLPSDVIAAILYAQLECLDLIQKQRKFIWNTYSQGLQPLQERGFLEVPVIPDYASNNAHMFYVLCSDLQTRIKLSEHLKKQNIHALFHYLPLHLSPFYRDRYKGMELPNCQRYSDCLLRLPLYYELTEVQTRRVVDVIKSFYL